MMDNAPNTEAEYSVENCSNEIECAISYESDCNEKLKKTGRQHFLDMIPQTHGEWSFYPEGFHFGKRCVIEGQRKGNCESSRETTLVDVIGRSRKGINQRAGLPMVSHGDKSYAIPEYSQNFHKIGSTLPAIDFSRSKELVSDTFIPLQPLQGMPRRAYNDKKKARELAEEKLEVAKLSKWKAAPALSPTL